MESLRVENLRCEYRKNPIGIDIPAPRLSYQIKSDERNTMQTSYQLQVAKDSTRFTDDMVWDTGKVDSDQSIHVEYAGPELESMTRYYYRVRVWDNKGRVSEWSEVSFFEMGFLHKGEWKAKWITGDCEKTEQCPMFRKEFKVRNKIKRARVYITSLGLYELYLNGKRVSDWLLTPGWTSYNKRLQYQTYDIAEYLNEDSNAVGVILGNGWYKGNLAWEGKHNIYGDKRALLFQMHIWYEDGTEDVVLSDESWKWHQSPILMSEIYHGETYDARLEEKGWDEPNYNDQGWYEASEIEAPKDILVAQENVPVRMIEKIKPIEIIHTPAGETVIDMGQNMVGWVRFSVRGSRGDKVILKHAEVLDKEGNFYIDNLRKAKQAIEYTLKGEEKEIFEPHFTFQGFRYVKVEEYPSEINLDDFTGIVIHSDMDKTGYFECSDELINKLQHNILWGQKGNFVDVPTDCPQRDERLGWTGDAQVFIRTACFNMNAAPFFTKWLRDLRTDQFEDGGMPHVIPNVLGDKPQSSSAWGDAAVICPWTIYLCYGDKKILQEQYDSMKAWVEYIRSQGDNEYLWNTGFHFGDWLGLDAKEGSYVGATDRDYIATAFYAYSTSILKKTAEVLGKADDADEYEKLYEKIIDNFKKEFVTPNGRISVPTQTAHVLALMFDLVDKKDRKRVIETLVKYLEENNNHLTTGFVGTPYLCHVLSQNGYNDMAYKLVKQKDYPSWLYQITKGATTIWEHWDGIKPDGSFWSADMNSFNHYAYGSIGDWFYRVVAGIDTDERFPGYKHICIKPQAGEGLNYVKARLESMYGTIESTWSDKEKNMEVGVCIPPNTTAEVLLPYAKLQSLYEGERYVKDIEGIISCEDTAYGVRLELGSGTYNFVYKKN